MTEVSNRVSLREIVGGVAPGAMVIASVLFVTDRIPGLGLGWGFFGTSWSALLVGFVVAYGIGTMLTSGTELAFDRVTQINTPRPDPSDMVTPPHPGWAERMADSVEPLLKRIALYLGGGKNIAEQNKEFSAHWHERAVAEGLVSSHTYDMAAAHYRALFDAAPEGEEALAMCEYLHPPADRRRDAGDRGERSEGPAHGQPRDPDALLAHGGAARDRPLDL